MTDMDLEAKVAHFPTRPGVYRMKDERDRVLYVGKGKNLRSRVRSYFREGGDGRPQIQFLMARTRDIDYVVTDTEKEALILENTLIKRHRPRYNVDLRDDKTYVSLRLDIQNPFPRLGLVRRIDRDGALYFGPYSSARSLHATVELLHRIFPLRQCRDREFHARTRPCLYCQMRGCRAPCCGLVDEAAYRQMVDQVVAFLKGRSGSLLADLREQMSRAAAALEFEEAAQLRDRIEAVERTLERQKAVTHRPVDRDVVAFVREGADVQFAVLVVRGGNLIDRRAYPLSEVLTDDAEATREFLERYYRGDRIIPAEVVVGCDLAGDERALLEEWLGDKRGRRVRVIRPHRGERAQLVAMARQNATELMAERRRTKVGYEAALTEIGNRLGLSTPPDRIECYDISNVQGTEPVGSLVTFKGGFPEKGRYRRFVIRTVEGSNDFAMLYEVISRRLARRDREGWDLPDLLVVDGGKGQLAMAARAVADAGVPDLPLVGMAKARVQPGRGESVDHSQERFFLPQRKNPVFFRRNSSGLFLLQRLRDEAHRFAVTHHRARRSKAALTSQLEGIPGVGEKRRAALLRGFGSLERLKSAPVEEVARVPGISPVLAERIVEALKTK